MQAIGGVSYQWSNGLGSNANQSLTQVGSYTVTVTGISLNIICVRVKMRRRTEADFTKKDFHLCP